MSLGAVSTISKKSFKICKTQLCCNNFGDLCTSRWCQIILFNTIWFTELYYYWGGILKTCNVFMKVHYVLEEGGETFIIEIAPSFPKSANIRRSSYHRAQGVS